MIAAAIAIGRILLNEVLGGGQFDHFEVAECRTHPRDRRAWPEGDIPHAPDQQGWLGAERGGHVTGEPLQQRMRRQDFLGHLRHAHSRRRVGLHPAVMLHHRFLGREFGSSGNQPLDEEVSPQDRVLHRPTGHDLAEDLGGEVLRRPEPGIAQHDSTDPIGTLDRDRHADRTTPVLAHRQVAVQTEMVDELADHAGMFVDLVAESSRPLRQAEAEVVQSYAAEAVSQRHDDVAIQEAPRRIAVAEQDGRSVSLVDVMNPAPRAVKPARLERIQLGIRCELHSHCPSGPSGDSSQLRNLLTAVTSSGEADVARFW